MTGRAFDLRSTVLVVAPSSPRRKTGPSHAFVRMATEGKRAALCGIARAAARDAVDVFVKDGLLERFLDLAWRR